MSKPTLSVIMPNYNHAHYIREALEAILSQSYRPLEVIVVDDASTDNSVEIIEQFVKRGPIVRLIKNEKNMGAVHTAQKLLNFARGGYIYGASADDKILPGFFEKSMNLLSQYPQAGLCCSDPVFFDDKTGVISENRFRVSSTPCFFSPDAIVKLIKKTPFWIAGHTSIIKRTSFLETGGLIPELKWHCDWFAILVIAFRYGICYIPEPLASLRVHPNSYSKVRDWPFQREVLTHLITLLKSPAYRDVLPYFQRSGVMSHFGDDVVRVVKGNPKHWDIQTIMLIRKPLWNEVIRAMNTITHSPVKRLYRSIRARKI
ncbi:MAG: glycosyltransferase [Nitrospirota bacterium]